ncbi:MAG: cold shock domain-containing protein [Armatimonadetes bacterium]|nr:cold shock domain-containing protein [Armatimonadota bacterium]
MLGTVRWFDVRRGFGFIVPDDGGPDVFLYRTVLHAAGRKRLDPGQRVEYEAEETPRGRKATRVAIISSSA